MLKTRKRGCDYAIRVLILSLITSSALPAQEAVQPAGLTPMQAVEAALRTYPSVRVSQDQVNAAAAGIQLARTAYLPRVDALAQVNRAETDRYQQIATDLKAEWHAAVATLSGARRIAANTPIQVSAARTAADQATARYQAGLSIIDAVAEAERLLAQSEIDDALARLGVWRGLLAIATAAGDIQPFLAEASR